MEQSDELRDLTLRLYEAGTIGDLSFFDRHISRHEGVVFVGLNPNEWWEGFEAIRERVRAQSEQMGGMQIVPGQIQAYREGSVGWVIDGDASFRMPDGTELPFRSTSVFRQEDGEWKVVQNHASFGVSSEDMVGGDVTL